MQFINPWYDKNNPTMKKQFIVSELLYVNGHFSIYQGWHCYLYTYKGTAINQLAGMNTKLIDCLANDDRPTDNLKFLFDRAKTVIDKYNKSF